MKIKHLLLCVALVIANITTVNAQEDSKVILENAYAQAKKGNKNVFIMFHASWCSWCKKMDKNMMSKATKQLFEDNYVIEHLTVMESKKKKSLENPGAQALFNRYSGGNAGLPFWLIFDSNGKLVEDSRNEKGDNIGCPATPDEVAQFVKKLKVSSKLTDEDLEVITNQFVIKK